MLDFIRRSTKGGIGKLIMSAAMGLLILSFGIWGINDVFRGRSDNSVAKVGGEKISAQEVQQAFRRELDMLRRQSGGQIDAEQARAMGFDKRVLAELINAKLLELAARDIGIAVPDAVLLQQIQDIAAFKGDTGHFDKARFERALQSLNYTEDSFATAFRGDILRKYLMEALLGGTPVPDSIAKPLFAFQAERRVIRYVVLPPEQAGTIAPTTDDEIRALYEKNKAAYMAPEYRKLTIVQFDPATLAKSIQIPEEELRKRFEADKDKYSAPEKRALQQLVFPTEAEARAAADQIKGGKSFLDVAKAQGKTEDDVTIGEKTKTSLSPAPLADAAFAAPQDGVTEPVEGPFGWVVMHVAKILPPEGKSFEDVKAGIATAMAQEKAKDQLREAATRFEDARASGTPLEEAAKAQNIAPLVIPAIDAEDKDPTGAPVAALAGKEQLVADAFKANVGGDPDLIQAPDGAYYVVRVDSVTPPAQRPLDAVKDDIRKEVDAAKRQEALSKKAGELASKAQGAGAIVQIANSTGLKPASQTLARRPENEVLTPETVAAVYDAKEGAILSRPAKSGAGVVLLQLEAIAPPPDEEVTKALSQIKPQIGQLLGDELFQIYSEQLQDRYKVTINEEALQSAVGGS